MPYEIIKVIKDQYYFAGSVWNSQIAKRFILNTKRFNKIIESSYYLHLKNNNTPFNVAFEPSTSFGCAVGCLFCASGNLFPIKQLNSDEIAKQVFDLVKEFKKDFPNFQDIRKDVFYSGIGEPTLIMNTIIDASKKIINELPGLSFKLSTMGASPKSLIHLADSNIPIRSIQIGIPHYDEEKIKHLYSKCSNYSLQKVLSYTKEFINLRPETNIKINYIVIKNYNDSDSILSKTIEAITKILGTNIDFKISCLNLTDFAKQNSLSAVNEEILESLIKTSKAFGLNRVYTFGPMSEEKLGCGQLAGNYQKSTGQ